MNTSSLSDDHKKMLLSLARETIECGAAPLLDLGSLPSDLRQDGATFVTLTTPDGELRGCIGTLEARQPLALDVCEHALAAAREDWRFPPVSVEEARTIKIEISRLTPPQRLDYTTTDELLECLHPGVDGVILRDGFHRATFLPQVWEKLPDKEAFLSHLCQKMGLSTQTWRHRHLDVLLYQVEEFKEE